MNYEKADKRALKIVDDLNKIFKKNKQVDLYAYAYDNGEGGIEIRIKCAGLGVTNTIDEISYDMNSRPF